MAMRRTRDSPSGFIILAFPLHLHFPHGVPEEKNRLVDVTCYPLIAWIYQTQACLQSSYLTPVYSPSLSSPLHQQNNRAAVTLDTSFRVSIVLPSSLLGCIAGVLCAEVGAYCHPPKRSCPGVADVGESGLGGRDTPLFILSH